MEAETYAVDLVSAATDDDDGRVFLSGLLSKTMAFKLVVYGHGEIGAGEIGMLIKKLGLDHEILFDLDFGDVDADRAVFSDDFGVIAK